MCGKKKRDWWARRRKWLIMTWPQHWTFTRHVQFNSASFLQPSISIEITIATPSVLNPQFRQSTFSNCALDAAVQKQKGGKLRRRCGELVFGGEWKCTGFMFLSIVWLLSTPRKQCFSKEPDETEASAMLRAALRRPRIVLSLTRWPPLTQLLKAENDTHYSQKPWWRKKPNTHRWPKWHIQPTTINHVALNTPLISDIFNRGAIGAIHSPLNSVLRYKCFLWPCARSSFHPSKARPL